MQLGTACVTTQVPTTSTASIHKQLSSADFLLFAALFIDLDDLVQLTVDQTFLGLVWALRLGRRILCLLLVVGDFDRDHWLVELFQTGDAEVFIDSHGVL